MADNTIIQQGYFTSTGVAKTIVLRSDIDWMETWNLTTTAGTTQWDSTYHYWQREMSTGDHIIHYHGAATNAIHSVTGLIGFNGVASRPGFTPIDSSVSSSTTLAVTAGTNVVAPVYSIAATSPFTTGAVYRIYGGAHTNINGLDFTGTVIANTSVTVTNALATAPGVVNGAGFIKMIAPDIATYKLFTPGRRVIANITAAAAGVVTTLVDHGYITGQIIRMSVPSICGMTELNGQVATITVLTAGTFSINIDTTGYTAFNFPLPAVVPFTPAEVMPVGEVVTSLASATENVGFIGITLGSLGAVSGTPTGVANDVIKWRAGKSFATFI